MPRKTEDHHRHRVHVPSHMLNSSRVSLRILQTHRCFKHSPHTTASVTVSAVKRNSFSEVVGFDFSKGRNFSPVTFPYTLSKGRYLLLSFAFIGSGKAHNCWSLGGKHNCTIRYTTLADILPANTTMVHVLLRFLRFLKSLE